MKLILYSLLLLVCINLIHSQPVATLSGSKDTVFYGSSSFQLAHGAANPGDTIYLSGGGFSGFLFAKPLTVFGTGIHPDSTKATFATIITSQFDLDSTASNSYFDGITFASNVYKDRKKVATNINFTRCLFQNNVIFGTGSGTPALNSSGFSLIGNIFMYPLDLSYTEFNYVSNNIFQASSHLANAYNSQIKNNIFSVSSTGYRLEYCSNNLISNNIFYLSYVGRINRGSGNIYTHNIFVDGAPSLGDTPQDINNYKSINLSTVFITLPPNIFSFTNDYRLISGIEATYPGDDGTEPGIYGGVHPTKGGWVPANPHISSKTVAPLTNSQGALEVEFKVIGQ